ncbi:sodium/calcium exchanger membrane region, EF-hand domain pair [Artemisia annua]|uniref:Sodium/calcium exchanger membrane region, EF-hand domain pair n=1 Tax=Artemisia annua TaxID=35608 RepID=A0A2U1NDR7_ARTAN|nr:sodium/calcium exchanger membrane region, EF-hand domain pair [Artemisia annua]
MAVASETSDKIYSGGIDNVIKVCDLRRNEVSMMLEARKVTACSSDRMVYIWETTHRNILYKLPSHIGSVNECVFHHTEPIIGSCSSNKWIYLGEICGNELRAMKGLRMQRCLEKLVTPDEDSTGRNEAKGFDTVVCVIPKLFNSIGANKDGSLSLPELRALVVGMQLYEINVNEEDAVTKVMKDFDTSENNEVEFNEFVAGETKKKHDLLGYQAREDEEQKGIDDPRMTTIKVVLLLLLGTAIAAAFADPLVDAVGSGSEGADSSLQKQYNKDLTVKASETIALSILNALLAITKHLSLLQVTPNNMDIAKVVPTYHLYTPAEVEVVIDHL